MSEPMEIYTSSGNVFADLGLPDAEVLQLKSLMVAKIYEEMEARGLTQVETAKIIGIRQPKLSALLKGNLDGFSIDRLVRCLNRLGQQVEVVVKQRQVG